MQLLPHHVHIWPVDLTVSPAREEAFFALLNETEHQRVHRIRLSTQRQRFIVARGSLRLILSIYLSVAPNQIEFVYGEHKKPLLADSQASQIHFNLSHSEDKAVIAVTLKYPIGIDIEKIKPTYNSDIAKRYFSAIENQQLQGLAKNDQAIAFYTTWSRKEAVSKALGTGISFPLANFSVSILNEDEQITLEQKHWTLKPLPLFSGFACSVATQQSINAISYWQLTTDGYIMIKR